LPRQQQKMAQITRQVIAVNQEAAYGELRVFCRTTLSGYFVGWARLRSPTLAAYSMRLIEGKVNIGK
jgi:hypothetical protein